MNTIQRSTDNTPIALFKTFGLFAFLFIFCSCGDLDNGKEALGDLTLVVIDNALGEGTPIPCDNTTATPHRYALDGISLLPNIADNDHVLAQKGEQLVWLDLATGNTNILDQNQTNFFYSSQQAKYQSQHKAAIAVHNEVRLLDLEDGRTLATFQNKMAPYKAVLCGNENRYYVVVSTTNSQNKCYETIYTGDIDGLDAPQPFLTPAYHGSMGTGHIVSLDVFQDQGQNLMLVYFLESVNKEWTAYLGLYNLDQQTWIYTAQPALFAQKGLTPSRIIPAKNGIYCVPAFDKVYFVDARNGELRDSLAIIGNDKCFTDGRQAALYNSAYNTLSIIDLETRSLLHRIALVGEPVSVNFEQQRLVNLYDGKATIYHLKTGATLQTIVGACNGNERPRFAQALLWANDKNQLQVSLGTGRQVFTYDVP